jgi:hypothetical protein
MSTSNFLGTSPISFVAGGTITQYAMVKLHSTAGQVVVTDAIADLAIGVALTGAATGGTVAVQTFGRAKVVAGDVIALGAQVMCKAAAAGNVLTAAGATAKSVGVALMASGADGDIIEVLLATPNVNGVANS